MTEDHQRSATRKSALLLGLLSLLLYSLMAYGGIRSPDEEAVFRVGRALAENGSFALERLEETLGGFSVARGTDGKLYSHYAPGQAIVLAPVIRAALRINQTRWYDRTEWEIPVSFCVDATSLRSFLLNLPVDNRGEHALRFLTALSMPVISSLLVVAFFFLMRQVTASAVAAVITAGLLAFATPVWSYADTLFKEPLAMLWLVLGLLLLTGNDPLFSGKNKRYPPLFPAGIMLGLALATHVSAVLFVPFFIVYAGWPQPAWRPVTLRQKSLVFCRQAAVFVAGFLVPALAFAGYNYARFGSIWEVGRTASQATMNYPQLALPVEGLLGFLVSPGKGLIWYCPLVVLAAWTWPRLHARHRVFSAILVAAIVFRLVFLSCRTDWHGGFCLGPRHLLLILPILFIPLGLWIKEILDRHPGLFGKQPAVLAGLFFAAAAQQIYFCLGEPISFYYLVRNYFFSKGVSILTGNDLYFQWNASPLLYLLEGRRGPFLLQEIPLTNYQLLPLLIGGFALLVTAAAVVLKRIHQKT
ncbi:MAG: hypothetical protein ACLFPD_04175 [Desulfosudaceae bacterium]